MNYALDLLRRKFVHPVQGKHGPGIKAVPLRLPRYCVSGFGTIINVVSHIIGSRITSASIKVNGRMRGAVMAVFGAVGHPKKERGHGQYP